MDWLDSYEIRARFAPSIIVFSPLALLAVFILPELINSLNYVLGETVVLVFLIYALSFVVKHHGKKIEPVLWSKWGGAPSTRFLRWSDSKFDSKFKEKIHESLKKQFEISLLSTEQEKMNPIEGDKQIDAAFLRVKTFLYRNDPEGIWKKHNMEYGFNRNLMGSRWIWLFFSIIGTIIFANLWLNGGEKLFFFGMLLCSIEVICSIIAGLYYLPSSAKEAADRYSENAWTTFLIISSQVRSRTQADEEIAIVEGKKG